jgi:hypothetical protein
MALRAFCLAFTVVICIARSVQSAPTAASPPLLKDGDLKELAGTLRTMLAQAIPPVLYEGSTNWGNTRPAPSQLKWHGARPKIYRAPRNDGTWRKIKLSTRNPAQSLSVDLRDPKYPDADHMMFTAALALDAGVDFEQQIWKAGTRLYSGSLRARMRVYLTLNCEFLLKMETGKGLLPDIVFRLRVVHSDLKYDNLVVEHVAGIGGTGAKVLGDALQSHIRQWHPSLERDLLARANAAIVRAADTREVRLTLSKLLKLPKSGS